MKRFALAGNPNSGKTTLFNCLTGSTAHVGNWPGVTVDKREGLYRKGSQPIEIVDLPGIYSLSPYSPEEVVARKYVLDDKPDCVIDVVDVTNIERNLYLTTQILEIDVPVVIALNMMDVFEKQGDKIDERELERRIGVPVVKISALKGEGLEELIEKAIAQSEKPREGTSVLSECELTHLIGDVKIALGGQGVDNPLFHAVKLVESDQLEVDMHPQTVKMVEEFKKTFSDDLFGVDFEALVADARYKYITKHYSPLVNKKQKGFGESKSDKVDKVLTNKWVGIPIFFLILFAVFHLTFGEDLLFLGSFGFLPTLEELGLLVSNADGELVPINFGVSLLSCLYDGKISSPGVLFFNLTGLLTDTVFGWITSGLENAGAADWAVSLVGDGILSGLSGVLSFIPQIVTLLLLLSVLEDTGYMARIAFILDRIFRRFGVSGRAFIPMIMGFGCSVPAIVNTRTLTDERERIMTLRVIPFFSCGAKLPILVAVAGAVANMCGLADGGFISFLMYVLGMVVAVVSILLMRSTTQKGEVSPFIMELPPYRAPSGKALAVHLWDKTKHYLEKAFTVILASTILVWFLSNFGWDWRPCDVNESILASLGKFVQPLFTPLGFGSQLNEHGWMFVVAAVTGLIAKEEVVATFGTLSAVFAGSMLLPMEGAESVALVAAGTGITWQALIAFIVFNMTTVPCMASVATAKGESPKGKFKWTLLFWLTASYITTAFTYTVLSWWWTAFIWVAVGCVVGVSIWLINKKSKKRV